MKKFWLGFLVGIGFSFLLIMILSYILTRMMGFDDEALSDPQLGRIQKKRSNYNLQLRDLHTDSIISDTVFKDKVLFFNFWEQWCTPCKREMPALERLYNTINDSLIFFGIISTENPELTKNDNVIKKYKLPFYYSNKVLPQEFSDDVVPRTYIIDKGKNIVVAEIGAAKWDDVSVVKLIDSLKASN